uniref:Putative ovule protein n=1 Tax=Solanum chacoense TaxID=4108 RepID=A0A0V0GIA1_SOLCH
MTTLAREISTYAQSATCVVKKLRQSAIYSLIVGSQRCYGRSSLALEVLVGQCQDRLLRSYSAGKKQVQD